MLITYKYKKRDAIASLLIKYSFFFYPSHATQSAIRDPKSPLITESVLK